MLNTFLILLLGEPQLNNIVCTPQQLEKASEVFIPCQGEKHFMECYKASVIEYCEIRRTK